MAFLPCVNLLALVIVGSATPQEEEWSTWMSKQSKTYTSRLEADTKRSIFFSNLRLFEERSRYDTATYGPDEYADLTPDEFNALRGRCFSGDSFSKLPVMDVELVEGEVAVQDVDWRDPAKNPANLSAVTRVKNQGPYGYCWAFGASGTLEGMNAIQQRNPLEELSEQEFIDCCSPELEGADSCWGRGPNMAWNFLINNTHGIDSTEASYPYQAHARPGENNMTCAIKSGVTVNGSKIVASKARVGSYVTAETDESTLNQDKILVALLKYGPGNIGVDANCLFGYKAGIISNCTGKGVDHATLVVGAGEENGMPYWIVKNSWGPHWGEQGFYRVERNKGQIQFSAAAFAIAAPTSNIYV
jgi:hypothetical protein